MRFVKRRRLCAVVIVAMLAGSVLPWVEYAAGNRPRGVWEKTRLPYVRKLRLWDSDCVVVNVDDHPHQPMPALTTDPTIKDIQDIREVCFDFLPVDARARFADGQSFLLERFGWPLRAIYMYHWYSSKGPDIPDVDGSAVIPGVSRVWGIALPQEVPARVLCVGMIGNVLLSGLVVGGVYFGAARVRSYLRMRRGECWKCGYPVGTSERCAECGVRAP